MKFIDKILLEANPIVKKREHHLKYFAGERQSKQAKFMSTYKVYDEFDNVYWLEFGKIIQYKGGKKASGIFYIDGKKIIQ